MKKILFISFPVSGHVNPQFCFNKELSQQNVKLIYYTFHKYFDKYKDVENIELREYPDSFRELYDRLSGDSNMHSKLLAMLYVFYAFTEIVLPYIIKEVETEKPDLIICDSLAMWGKVATRYHNIPYCYFFTSFMGDSQTVQKSPAFKLNIAKSILLDFPYLVKMLAIQKKIKKQYGMLYDQPMNMMSHQGKFTMVMTSKEFHPTGIEYPSNVRFVGPAHVENCDIPENKDTILISLGTILYSDTHWDACIEAAKDLGCKVVVTFGGNTKNKVNTERLPSNVEVYNNLSQEDFRDVLKHSAVFISHGGFNSISDAVLYRTPLIICPTTAEQAGNGEFIEKYGCGLLYNKKRIHVQELREKIQQVMDDKSFQDNVEKYRQSFLNSIGMGKVVEELNKEFNLY
ncbi:MAG: glycosyltransferase [Clostridia bacterium]|jgi:MGT family glycosyltransferase|nr:glycosyltransferase [Clostridia bacterium]